MLTALHITLPKKCGDRCSDDRQQYPNRCLVVNDATNHVRLISTEAALKYMDKNISTQSPHERQVGAQFCFGHITTSPHHESIFIKQVVPMLYDLCRTFHGDNTQNMTRESCERSNLSKPDTKSMTQSMNRTVFIYGSQSATDRRSLFLYLSKAVAQALLQQTGGASASTYSVSQSCEVSFSLVDLYHKWGVGDVLDLQSVMHDSAQLERVQRKQPRWSLNEPKGIAFVEPTRHLIDKRENSTTTLLRSLQRTDAPRGLRTESEKADHETKSTLVLTFYLSPNGTRASRSTIATRTRSSRREFFDDSRHSHVQYTEYGREARLHLILLPDSDAAVHGKQAAQELGAIGGALRACAHWFTGEEDKVKSANVSADAMFKGTHRALSASSSVTHWAPLRESSLLLYVFESTLYYTRQKQRSQRQLLKQQRNLNRSREVSRSRSVSPTASVSSNSRYGSAQRTSIANTSTGFGVSDNQWLTSAVDVVECISSGIGQSLLVVCVNSGWDQYYNARSAFLFAQRATNQLNEPATKNAIKLENDLLCNPDKNMDSTASWIDPSAVHAHTNRTKDEANKHTLSDRKGREVAFDLRSSVHNSLMRTPDTSSPHWNVQTQPRQGSPQPMDAHYAEKRTDESFLSFTRNMPSEVSVRNDDVDMYSSDNIGSVNGDRVDSNENAHGLPHFASSFTRGEVRAELQQDTSHTSVRQLFSPNNKQQCSEEPLQPSHPPQEHVHHHHQQQQQEQQQLSTREPSAVRVNRTLHPYAPIDDGDDGVVQSVNVTDMQDPLSPPLNRRVRQNIRSYWQSSSQRSAISDPPSPGVNRTTSTVDNESNGEEALDTAYQNRAAALREENERLRAMFALMSSREADAWNEKAMRNTGVASVCNAELINACSAARSADLGPLRAELIAVKKKAQLLERSLTRSVEENRKMRRTLGRKLQRTLVDLPRALRDVVQQGGGIGLAVGEERVERWEELLRTTAECVSQVVQRLELSPVHATEMNTEEREKEEEEEEEEEEEAEEETVRIVHQEHLSERKKPLNHSVKDAMRNGCSIRTSGEKKNFGENISRATQSDSLIDVSSPALNTDPQIVELLRIAHQLLMKRKDAPSDDAHLEEKRSSRKFTKLSTGETLSESIMQSISSGSGKRAERSEQFFGGEDTCVKENSRNHVDCERFVRLLGDFLNQVSTKGNTHEPHLNTSVTNLEKLTNNDAAKVISQKVDALSKVRESSAALRSQTEVCSSPMVSHLTVKRLEAELESEREGRRQLQDEIIRLRAQLGECESKLLFIESTVKRKVSKDIIELEHALCERKARQAAERQQRSVVMSEIRKRLEDVAAMAELGVQTSPHPKR